MTSASGRVVADRAEVVARLGEVFRERGYEGASLSVIEQRTGLGKGSLYHFFPGGKEAMAAAVLADIADWFEREVFSPLEHEPEPQRGLTRMFEAVKRYFWAGGRVCLVGVFALGATRDAFGDVVHGYFVRWVQSLADALVRGGLARKSRARVEAEAIVAAIQGALVLARALDDRTVFARTLKPFKRAYGIRQIAQSATRPPEGVTAETRERKGARHRHGIRSSMA